MDFHMPKRVGVYIGVFVGLVLCIPIFVSADGLVPCEGANCNFSKLVQLAENIIDFLLFKISVPIAGILFAYAGFLYVTASGNPGQVGKATGVFKNVAGGFIIALSAWLLVKLITTGIGVKEGFGGL